MNSEELKRRTKKFALDAIRLVEGFPKTRTRDVIGRQLMRSATSIGANYRSACRSQSHAHFVSKISVVEEEADESLYWLELASDSGLAEIGRIDEMIQEANELTSIFTASRRTARKNHRTESVTNPKIPKFKP